MRARVALPLRCRAAEEAHRTAASSRCRSRCCGRWRRKAVGLLRPVRSAFSARPIGLTTQRHDEVTLAERMREYLRIHLGRTETVADASDRFDERPGFSEFFAEALDVRVDGSGLHIKVQPPHVVEQGLA